MWPTTEQISYRLKNGVIVNYIFDAERGLTLDDINNVANICVEAFQVPQKVFIRMDLYSSLMKNLMTQVRYTNNHIDFSVSNFILSCGDIVPVAIPNSYIPFLVGDDEDFADNDFYKVFEEAING